ncbi:MAG: TRAP transporter small permease [Rhodoferax sp.]|uniref:TRAP transporter small permease n=1 Tax=Rhodoferax sp. TaxID=50421 RepID=UPI00261FEA09|nr:TRAP transporter small permease [Rhodoferax sp.]MDD2882432.1 TRAP transporter small permease [Rhodoferax sp.]
MVQKLITRYCQLLSVLIVICLVAMVLMVFGNVVMRYAFNSGIAVSEELSRWLFLWLIFLGASIAVHEQGHMGSDMVMEKLSPKWQKMGAVVAQFLMLWVTWLLFTGSLAQTKINWDVMAPVTEYSMAWVYSTGVVFSVSTGLMLLSDLWYTLRGEMTPTQIRKAHHAAEQEQFEINARVAEERLNKSSATH